MDQVPNPVPLEFPPATASESVPLSSFAIPALAPAPPVVAVPMDYEQVAPQVVQPHPAVAIPSLGAAVITQSLDALLPNPSPVIRKAPKPATGSSVKKPKRPKTAYHFFYDEKRTEACKAAAAAEPAYRVNNNALSQQLGADWKSLDADGRKRYEDLAASAKAEYDAAITQFKDGGGRVDDCVPTKPLSAYMLYFRGKHEQNPGVNVTEFAALTGAEWKALDDVGKQPYNDEATTQREIYDAQVAFCQKAGDALVGQRFLDYRKSVNLRGSVTAYDATLETGTLVDGPCYTIAYDDGRAPESLGLGELKARVCGNEKKAAKAAAATSGEKKPRSSGKRKPPKEEVAAAVPDVAAADVAVVVPAEDPAPKRPKREPKKPPAKKPPPEPAVADVDAPPIRKAKKARAPDGPQLPEEEILNVIRLSRRLVGGADLRNLKKMCAAAGLDDEGGKPRLASRLEYFLREKDFPTHAFTPTAADVERLSIDDFNDKYQETKAYQIRDIEKVLRELAGADAFVSGADVAASAAEHALMAALPLTDPAPAAAPALVLPEDAAPLDVAPLDEAPAAATPIDVAALIDAVDEPAPASVPSEAS
ncbi:hypothetical protein SO694_00051167 [Aureococcus anophagefferens]|uniref:HMG box domain-containing protein n=1 Tax=Aureococcus anophagefferens TaxID=44056 RepID=A0ABR1FYC0_AURAN